jgi:hypothetical protein
MNCIELYEWTKGEVIARYTGPHSKTILDLFGTDCLPTPYVFDSGLRPEDVIQRKVSILNAIQASNPNVIVTWKVAGNV